jgi:hypothetical protein
VARTYEDLKSAKGATLLRVGDYGCPGEDISAALRCRRMETKSNDNTAMFQYAVRPSVLELEEGSIRSGSLGSPRRTRPAVLVHTRSSTFWLGRACFLEQIGAH